MSWNPDIKRGAITLIVGLILAAITGVAASHIQTAQMSSEVRALHAKTKEVIKLREEVQELEKHAATLDTTVARHTLTLNKVEVVLNDTREYVIKSEQTLHNVAKSQENLGRVAQALEITVARLETLIEQREK